MARPSLTALNSPIVNTPRPFGALNNPKPCKVDSLYFLGLKRFCKSPSPERIGGSRHARILQSIGGGQKPMSLPLI
jgi:hypothetical protein